MSSLLDSSWNLKLIACVCPVVFFDLSVQYFGQKFIFYNKSYLLKFFLKFLFIEVWKVVSKLFNIVFESLHIYMLPNSTQY